MTAAPARSPFALRYRTDPTFRARKLELQAKYRATRNRQRQRLQYLHRRIFELRASVANHMEKAETAERALLKATAERARIQAEIRSK